MRKPLSPLKAVWYKSWTEAWGEIKIASGALLLSISELNSYVNDPTFKSYLSELDIPKTLSIALVVIGIITWLAHGRKDD